MNPPSAAAGKADRQEMINTILSRRNGPAAALLRIRGRTGYQSALPLARRLCRIKGTLDAVSVEP
jgi:hypothetical protein